jgi:hypothetical protein
MDSRGLDFLENATARLSFLGSYAQAWSGWVWWFTGLSQADKIDISLNTVEEMYPINFNLGTQFAYPTDIRETSSAKRDKATNIVKALQDKGLAAASWIDTAIDVTKTAWGVGRRLVSALGGFGALMSPMPPDIFEIERRIHGVPQIVPFPRPQLKAAVPPPEEKEPFEDLSKSCLLRELRAEKDKRKM